MKVLVSIILISTLTACGNMVKGGAMIGAQKALEDKQFSDALSKADVAEHMGDGVTRENRAKINYIRGLALQGLGRETEALARFRYVAEHLAGTPHAYLAKGKLESMSNATESRKSSD